MVPATVERSVLIRAWGASRRLRFVAVGGWNTAFAYLAYGAVYALLHDRLHYLLISTIAHLLAVANAFICQRVFVFRSHTAWFGAFLRFNLVQLGVLAGGLAGMTVLVEAVRLRPFVSQMIVMAVAVVASYVFNSHFTFRTPR
jgi:putative flippase GtrA